MHRSGLAVAVLAIASLLALGRPASAYSVLTHEALIDATWDDGIRPILIARFGSSPAALKQARAYAYGGCVIQDMGYYPMSSRFFGDLAHYVRSGDFVSAMIRQARDMNELAFALGALAHYTADNYGHPLAVNRSVPLLFPKLERKFGRTVTYEDGRSAHVRTEFAFDVVQIARGRYLPQAYHDFIGYEVSKPLLERAFHTTYGLDLHDVFASLDTSVGTFRLAIGTLLPELTKAAWTTKQDDIVKADPSVTRQAFVFALSRRDFEDAWGRDYKRPNVGHRLLALFIRILPKVGPLKILAFKAPTPEAERLFLSSFQTVETEYRHRLDLVRRGASSLEDRNFDTGQPVRAGDYRLADEAFAELVTRLAKQQFAGMTPALRATILRFYGDSAAPVETKAHRREWEKLQANLALLRSGR
jgi:hypothetical protein